MRKRIPGRHVVGLDKRLTVVRFGVNRQLQEELLKEGRERTRRRSAFSKSLFDAGMVDGLTERRTCRRMNRAVEG